MEAMMSNERGRPVTFYCSEPGLWERLRALYPKGGEQSASAVVTAMIERHVRRKEAKDAH